jgi:hypothetical protein
MTIATAILAAAVVSAGAQDQRRPSWATASVADTVITLVERANDTNDGDIRKELLIEAERQARASIESGDDVGRRYALAVVLGLRANAEGGRSKVQAAAALHEELEAILAVEPDHPGARHLVGRLHAGIRRMSRVTRWLATNLLGGDALAGATWQAAEENLAYAEKHAPEVADHHLQLALLYRDTGRPHLAAEEAGHALLHQPLNALERAVHDEALRLRTELGQ